jgi:hypothetical protein
MNQNKKKIIFSLIAVGVLIIGLIIGLILVRQRQQLKSKAAPATTLQLVGPTLSVEEGTNFIVNVNINTAENLVAGVEMAIKYDPTKLEAEEVSPGSFLTDADAVGPFINTALGTISYSLLTSPGSTPKQGSGTVASIEFSALAPGTTSVSFNRNDTLVVALKEGGLDVLTTATAATINVLAATSTEPTATPTTPPGGTGDDDDVDDTSGSLATATPTATSVPTHTPTPTPTSTTNSDDSTAYSTPTPTTPADLPVTGFSWPIFMGIGVGLLLIIGSLLLIA